MQVEILDSGSKAYSGLVGNTFTPKFNKTGQGFLVNGAGSIVGNSRLDSREWTLLDTQVRLMERTILIGIAHLRQYGLVRSIGSIGVMQVDKRIQSERRVSDVTMSSRTQINNDRVER